MAQSYPISLDTLREALGALQLRMDTLNAMSDLEGEHDATVQAAIKRMHDRTERAAREIGGIVVRSGISAPENGRR